MIGPSRRRAMLGAVGGASLLGAIVLTATMPAERQGVVALEHRVGGLLIELETMAGLRDSEGRVQVAPLDVMVTQQGGPRWITTGIERAVGRDAALSTGGANLLRVEVVESPPGVAIRLGLVRRGWVIRGERPVWLWFRPWLGPVALGVAAAIGGVWGRWVLGLGIAAGCVQLGLAVHRWPTPPGSPSWIEAWAGGPLGVAVRRLAAALPEPGWSAAAAIIVFSAIVVAWDHSRSRGRGGWLLVRSLAISVGALAWIEGALRAGLAGCWTTPIGVVVLALMGSGIAAVLGGGRRGT